MVFSTWLAEYPEDFQALGDPTRLLRLAPLMPSDTSSGADLRARLLHIAEELSEKALLSDLRSCKHYYSSSSHLILSDERQQEELISKFIPLKRPTWGFSIDRSQTFCACRVTPEMDRLHDVRYGNRQILIGGIPKYPALKEGRILPCLHFTISQTLHHDLPVSLEEPRTKPRNVLQNVPNGYNIKSPVWAVQV